MPYYVIYDNRVSPPTLLRVVEAVNADAAWHGANAALPQFEGEMPSRADALIEERSWDDVRPLLGLGGSGAGD